jgi:multiple sugar transport system ATP-binding protein
MVFQNYALYPHLTVFENIAFPLRLAKLPDNEVREKVEHAADVLELKEHLQRKPSQLSGGQRQRVAMGRAIVRDAQAFLFDEPLSNLDAKLRGQMRTEISRLQRRLGVTTVYVTHDQTEAMTLGDRVAVLRKGILQQCATPRELYEHPVNLFVAGFIGAPPMNLLPATIEGGQVSLPFATVPAPDGIDTASLEGRLLVAGIRPEFFEHAEYVDAVKQDRGQSFTATVDVTEWLGNEQYAYVPYESPAEIRDQIDALAQELDMEAMRPQLIISLDPASQVREGEHAEFWVDVSRMHLFDPHTGDNLSTASRSTAGAS